MSFVPLSMNPATASTSVRREIERLLQEVSPTSNTTAWVPLANGYENATGFIMEFEVPGFAPDQLDVTAQDGALTISGKKSAPENADGTRALFTERVATSFDRSMRLPKTADTANIAATYANGVLTVRVAKLAAVAPRKGAINVGESVNAPKADIK